ncbi:MAG: protein kinase [Chthoniobacter sp.]|uniref:serine/threonine protein kinase n=1 Tax=Chthoniobacter sp. TaxID=2510640 RepID=UPI0032A486FD
MTLQGQTLGEFEILEALGHGGMGAVYKARQLSLKRLVALKTLQPAVADNEAYIARFRQEAIAAAALNHPNLVQVYSAGESDGLHWFSMEYVEGESARGRLKREGRIEPREAITIAICVATALQYGWRKASLIHRDIKPDNIFLSRDGEVKLGDLGLAKSGAETKGLTATGNSMGTPYYISPEQARDSKSVDFRADIYSLGCTLFHLVSGSPPFDGSSAAAIMLKHITEPTPSLPAVWPQCPPRLGEVVGKMMQKDAGARQQDYETLITDLRRAYAMPAAPPSPGVPAPPARPAPAAVVDDHRHGTYVIDLDLEASAVSDPASAPPGRPEPPVPVASVDESVISAIEADHAPPAQPRPDSASTPECETVPSPRKKSPPPVSASEVDPAAPTMPPSGPESLPPVQPGPASAGSGALRLVTPVESDPAAPMVSGPVFISPAVSARKPPGSDTPRKSFPLGKITVALLLVIAAWFYISHHGIKSSTDDPDDPAEAPNPASIWRDWVLESRRDGYFLYHRELVDQKTDVLFQKRAEANSQETFRNGKIRVRCVIPPPNLPAQYVQFYVRMAPDAKGVIRRYETYLTHDTIVFALNDSAQGVREIAHWPVPPTPPLPIDIVMEIEAKKDRFTVSLNRMVVGTAQDDTIPGAGTFGVDGPAETRLTTLSFINLDPTPPAVSPTPK